MALATNSTPGEVHLNGDIHTSNDATAPELTPTGVKPGTYNFPHVVVDQKGRVLSITEADYGDVPCADDLVNGIAKIGPVFDIGSPAVGLIDIPIATTSSHGTVKPGNGFTFFSGLISIQYPIAQVGAGSPYLGVVSIGANLGITEEGELTRGEIASDTVKGLVIIGDHIDVSSGVISLPLSDDGSPEIIGAVSSGDTDNIIFETTGSPTSSGVMDVGTNVTLKDTNQLYTAPQNSLMQTITGAYGSIILDATNHDVFDITTNGDLTISSITNMAPYQQIDIIVRLGDLVSEDTLTLNSSFFEISGNTVSGHTTLISCMQITDGGGNKAYTTIQPYMT